jgi:integrase
MAIFKRGKFYWYEFTHNGKRVRESTKQGDKETAKTLMGAERTRLARVDAGLESPGPKPQAKSTTVGDLLDGLKNSYESEGKGSAPNLSTIEQARTAFGEVRAADLTKEHVESYIRDRVKMGRRNSTINRITELVRRAYKVADLTPPKIHHLSENNNVRKGFFSNEEFRRVYVEPPADIRDFAVFGYLTGWRKGEIASLTWSDVEENVIRLRAENSKNREGRSVAIAGELAPLIERRKQARLANGVLTSLVFHRSGSQIADRRI